MFHSMRNCLYNAKFFFKKKIGIIYTHTIHIKWPFSLIYVNRYLGLRIKQQYKQAEKSAIFQTVGMEI